MLYNMWTFGGIGFLFISHIWGLEWPIVWGGGSGVLSQGAGPLCVPVPVQLVSLVIRYIEIHFDLGTLNVHG